MRLCPSLLELGHYIFSQLPFQTYKQSPTFPVWYFILFCSFTWNSLFLSLKYKDIVVSSNTVVFSISNDTAVLKSSPLNPVPLSIAPYGTWLTLCFYSGLPHRKQRNGSESEYTEKLQQYSKSLLPILSYIISYPKIHILTDTLWAWLCPYIQQNIFLHCVSTAGYVTSIPFTDNMSKAGDVITCFTITGTDYTEL